MEDTHIVDLYWARSERAITETSKKYGKYCYSIAFNILSNAEDADEIVNDTYLDAWNAMPPHRPAVLSTFLGKITRRLSIQKWRMKHAEKRGGGEIMLAIDELGDCIPSDNTIEREIEAAELAKNLNAFLQMLSTIEKDIFIGRYWFMLPIAEISAKTGFGESKIKTMLFRIRKKLRTYLKKRGY